MTGRLGRGREIPRPLPSPLLPRIYSDSRGVESSTWRRIMYNLPVHTTMFLLSTRKKVQGSFTTRRPLFLLLLLRESLLSFCPNTARCNMPTTTAARSAGQTPGEIANARCHMLTG